MSEAFEAPPAGAPLPPYDDVITPSRALLLAEHAVYVQKGFSTPENEARRLRADLDAGGPEPDWDQLSREVEAARVASSFGGDVEQGTVDLALVRRYKQLRDAEKAAGAEAKAMKEEADTIEVELVEMFSEAGLQNMNVDGKTVYLHRATFAQRCEGIDADDVKAALRAAGGGAEELVQETVNSQTLSAYVRELTDPEDENAPGLPAELVGIVSLGEKYSVRVIAAGRSKSKTRSK